MLDNQGFSLSLTYYTVLNVKELKFSLDDVKAYIPSLRSMTFAASSSDWWVGLQSFDFCDMCIEFK